MKNHNDLNIFHDQVMKEIFRLALNKLNNTEPPSKFTWFVTGSGGRFEQSLFSDQDHGFVYEKNEEASKQYFLALGEELSYGLDVVGYPYCNGNVMASNPLWCNSVQEWKEQLIYWMEEESWESIRNLQIFYDARMLQGEHDFVRELKITIHDFLQSHPSLFSRLRDNIDHIKKSIGPLGQIIVEDKGIHKGSINLKYAAFLPYVNAIRLLSMYEGIMETSTLSRMDKLLEKEKKYNFSLHTYKNDFTALLNYRIASLDKIDSYDNAHYLDISTLSKNEKQEIKQILKNGKALHQYVNGIIEKGVF